MGNVTGCNFIKQQISHHWGYMVAKALLILIPALFMQPRPREIILTSGFLKGRNGPAFVPLVTWVSAGGYLAFHLRGNLSGGRDINLGQ